MGHGGGGGAAPGRCRAVYQRDGGDAASNRFARTEWRQCDERRGWLPRAHCRTDRGERVEVRADLEGKPADALSEGAGVSYGHGRKREAVQTSEVLPAGSWAWPSGDSLRDGDAGTGRDPRAAWLAEHQNDRTGDNRDDLPVFWAGDRARGLPRIQQRAGCRPHAKALRKRWSTENQLHWSLDLSFREEQMRIRRLVPAPTTALANAPGPVLTPRDPYPEGSIDSVCMQNGANRIGLLQQLCTRSPFTISDVSAPTKCRGAVRTRQP